MSNNVLNAPSFTTRVPVQFLCPANTSLNITGSTALQNNPNKLTINTGTVAKTDLDISGNAHFRGDGELPPFSLELSWDALSYNDYLKLAALRPYYIHFVTYRNIGYYGKLICGGPASAKAGTSDIVALKAQFFPLTPSDYGGAQTVNRISTPAALTVSGPTATPAAPTVTVVGATGSTSYTYKIIARNSYGDSVQGSGTTVANGNATLNGTNYNTVSWTAVSGASSYIVLRNGSQVYSGSSTSVNDTGLTTTTYQQYAPGWIAASTTVYYWLTFLTITGETLPYTNNVGYTSGAGYSYNALSWTWPTSSAYCIGANLYSSATNDSTTSKLLAAVPNGLTATFSDWVGPGGVSANYQPPTSSTAYRGQWQAGIWFNETP